MCRHRQAWGIIIGIMLCMLVLLIYINYTLANETVPFEVSVDSHSGSELLSPWVEPESDRVYVFLPAYAKLENIYIYLSAARNVRLDGRAVEDGMNCEMLEWNTMYELTYSDWRGTYNKQLSFMKSGQLDALYIDTESGNMNYIHENKENKEKAVVRLYDDSGELRYQGDAESISGRGNATWNSQKKPYNIQLQQEAALLENGAAANWVLLANAADDTQMKNKLVMDFSQSIGMAYAPQSQWVDLYLNGEYAGLYLLCEKNEVHPERIDIDSFYGHLVSMEMYDRMEKNRMPHVQLKSKQALRIRYPAALGEPEMERLSVFWQSVEDAIVSAGDNETSPTWADVIDLESWVRKYLVDEVFANYDGGYISQYFYIDGSEETPKVYAGPVWDYDRALQGFWQVAYPNALCVERLVVQPGREATWFYALCQQPIFSEAARGIYTQIFVPELERLLNEIIPQYRDYIAESALLDEIRWNRSSGIEQSVEQLEKFIAQRMVFMSDYLNNKDAYVRVAANPNDESHIAYFAVKKGDTLSFMPDLKSTEEHQFLGWYYEAGDELADLSSAVEEDIYLYAKWQGVSSVERERIIKLLPLMCIALLGVVIFFIDIRRVKKGGRTCRLCKQILSRKRILKNEKLA